MSWRQENARPAWVRARPHAWTLAAVTVCFGAFMGQLDASIVTLTYRPLEHQFHASAAGVQWVSLCYLITLVALLAPIGRLSDHRGRKLSYLHGFVVFTVGSAACGLAPNLSWLLAARVVQAAGAALLQANSVALIRAVAPPGRLRSALGAQAGAQALGLALGPTAGGVIVSALGWRWVFALNVPVGLLAIGAAFLTLPRTADRAAPGSLDVRGSVLLGGAGAALLLALSGLSGLNLPAGWVEGLAAAGAASAWLMVRRQRRAADPVLPNAVLAAPGVGAGLVTALLTYWTLFGPLVLVPSVLETAGLSPVRAGLLLTALPAGFALGAAVGRRATWGASLAAGALLVSLVVPMREAWLAVLLAVVGVGLGAVAPVNNAQIMRSVPGQLAASAGALLNMTRALGTALGIATVTLADHTGGPRLALATLFATAALAAAIVAVMGRRRPRRIMPDHAARPGRSVVGVPDPSLRG